MQPTLRPSCLALVTGFWLGLGAPAHAADPSPTERLRARALAASCAQCHGTEGHGLPDGPVTPLAGKKKDFLLGELMAFRSGQKPATVMHQISKGYTPEQLEALAQFFAAQK